MYLQGSDGLAGLVVSKNGTPDRTYYYRKNVRGDITHILDDSGNVKGEYVYDAWGNHVIVKNDDGVASLNPFRYRGYYYDAETDLYYLKSRYYDPQTGRFISADGVDVFEESQTDINGLNLYAYCSNNPVMFCDPTGQFFGKIKKFVGAVVGAVVEVVNIVSNAVNDTIDTVCNWVDDNLELILTVVVIVAVIAVTVATAGVGGVLAGALIGAALGAISGAALDIISQGFANGFDNINWGSVGKAALVGGILGGIGGGVGGKMASMAGKTAGSIGSKTAARAASSVGSKATARTPKVVDGSSKWAGKSWTTVRKNYWKEQAATPGGWFGNQRAARGLAPFSKDGSKMVLHHPSGREGTNLYRFIPMSMKEHNAFHKEFGRHFYNGTWNFVKKLK